ncbi:MAG: efflux RND transporter periplasmic adaptor subunit [Candidatus Hydrogenedentes bacterium]|nr:efflux RND transporter periplasmic adaptor subunit [Candidatus Hydrogenedentota bacterium]
MSDPSKTKSADVAKALGAGKTRSRFRRVRNVLVLLLLAGVAVGYGVYRLNQKETNGVAYVTQAVRRGDLVVTVSATGTLEPIKQVEVGIEVSGTINEVEVDYNDTVEVGQVLARLDTSKLEAQALQSQAALEAAKARLLQAQATVQEAEAQMARLNEVRELSDGKMPSQSEFDTQRAAQARARADEASAKAAVSQAQASLDANRSDLEKAVVRSPINGVVLVRSIEPGQTVAAQFQSPVLFTLAEDLAQMELQVDVDEADVGVVREDQAATFTVDAYPDRQFPARTTQVRFGSETVDGVVTYKTVLKVDNSSLSLRPGMTATAQITVDKRENVLLVPNTALRFMPPQTHTQETSSSAGGLLSSILPHPPPPQSTPRETVGLRNKDQHVWVLREGQLTMVPITKGLSDGRMTEVTGGALEEGMDVVTDTEATAP